MASKHSLRWQPEIKGTELGLSCHIALLPTGLSYKHIKGLVHQNRPWVAESGPAQSAIAMWPEDCALNMSVQVELQDWVKRFRSPMLGFAFASPARKW